MRCRIVDSHDWRCAFIWREEPAQIVATPPAFVDTAGAGKIDHVDCHSFPAQIVGCCNCFRYQNATGYDVHYWCIGMILVVVPVDQPIPTQEDLSV
jgi:hypothetical protein